jgi:hypothetical protein
MEQLQQPTKMAQKIIVYQKQLCENGGFELSPSESKFSSSYAEFPSSDAKKFILVMDTTCHAARSIPP